MDKVKEYMADMPAYNPKFFRVDGPKPPRFSAEELYRLVPFNQNQMVEEYYNYSRPVYCAQHGLVDELTTMVDMRKYLCAVAGAAYQNPKSICPQHVMLIPRSCKG